MLDQLASREWILSGPGSVRGIVLVFASTRSRIVAAELEWNGRQVRLVTRRSAASVLWDEEAEIDEAILRVRYRGEPPHIARAAWVRSALPDQASIVVPKELVDTIRDHEKLLEASVFSTFVGRMILGNATAVGSITPDEIDAVMEPPSLEEVFRLRRQANDADARVRAFFLEFDYETSGEDPAIREHVSVVGRHLTVRLEERALWAGPKGNQRVPVFPLLNCRQRRKLLPALQWTSSLFATLVDRHLVRPGEESITAWAFERFVSDATTVAHRLTESHGHLAGHGAPDGVQFFKLGELALICIENDIHVTHWRTCLPALVRATHAFVEQRGFQAGSGTMSGTYRFRDGVLYPRLRLDGLRSEYKALLLRPARAHEVLEDAFSSIAGQALFGVSGWPTGRNRPLQHIVCVTPVSLKSVLSML